MNCCTWFSSCIQGGGVNESAYSDVYRAEADKPKETTLGAADALEEIAVPSGDSFCKFIPLTKKQHDDRLGYVSSEEDYQAYFDGFIANQKNLAKQVEDVRDWDLEESMQQFIEYRQKTLQAAIQAEWDWEESYEQFKGAADSADIPSAMEFRLQWVGDAIKVQLYSADQKV
jgi:hypothetical protein